MTNPLVYVTTKAPDDAVFKFSPSKFAKFIQSPHVWYRSEILGEDEFSHSTSTVIGTIVHYCAEQVAKGEDVDQKMINEYVYSLEVHDEYEPEVVLHQYIMMAECLVNDYVLDRQYLEIESEHITELRDGYFAGGKTDALEGEKTDCMITDYKSYNSKTKPKTIKADYKYQLLVYAVILRRLGYNVTRIRLVYVNRNIVGEISEKTGKQMKSYPPEVVVLTENITDEDMDFMESLLDLAIDTCEVSKAHPELAHVIWHDPRLKP